MGGTAKGGRAAVWKGRIAEQGRSGLSIAEFCRRQGISAPSFYVWRKRLRRGRAISSSSGIRYGGAGQSRSEDGPLFVPIELAAASGVRLELPGGAVLTLPGDVSVELVTAAIQAALGAPRQERSAC